MGTPQAIYSDQESGLLSVFKQYCIIYGIEQHTSLPRSQFQNSISELGVKYLKSKLTALFNDPEFRKHTNDDWTTVLPDIALAINTTPFSHYSFSRELLHFGYESPGTIPFADAINAKTWTNIEDYVSEMTERTQKAHNQHQKAMTDKREHQ
jgi:hypothetical protein